MQCKISNVLSTANLQLAMYYPLFSMRNLNASLTKQVSMAQKKTCIILKWCKDTWLASSGVFD